MTIRSIEEELQRRKGHVQVEEMSQMDKDICGASFAKHLIIPMCDVYNLRRIAGLLHGLAADLDQLSRRHDLRARTIILEVRATIDDCNKRVREMTGKGKGKNRWEIGDN